MNSYSEYLQPFLPYISSRLMSRQCLDDILFVTRSLPPTLAINPFHLECSLDERPITDFSVCAMASYGGHAALSKLGSTGTMALPFANRACWEQIRRFALSWADASSLLHQKVEEVWLEFDICSNPDTTREAVRDTPSVFFSLGYTSPQELALRKPLALEYVRAAKEALDLLQGQSVSPTRLSRLSQCFDCLPKFARVLFVGAMISRQIGTIRVVLSGMSLDDMAHYLRSLGSHRPVDNFTSLAEISDLTDYMWLAIDIDDEGVSPRIGFDCYCGRLAQPSSEQRWRELLDYLVQEGMCVGYKRDALLGAGSMDQIESDERSWPDSLRMASRILGPAGLNRMMISLHHVKIIERPGLPLEAKGYLCGSYR